MKFLEVLIFSYSGEAIMGIAPGGNMGAYINGDSEIVGDLYMDNYDIQDVG